MKGTTIMYISKDEMIEVVEFYLNNNLLNTTFQAQHKSRVLSVHERGNGRFAIDFVERSAAKVKPESESTARAASGD